MSTLIISCVILGILVAILKDAKSLKTSDVFNGFCGVEYTQKPLMTETERSLYYRIHNAIDGEFLLFAQVQLTGFIDPAGGKGKQTRLNKIHRKSVDFLVCNKTGTAIAAIELQDWTHSRPDRIQADKTKAAALKTAGVPLIEFHARNLPNIEEIKAKIREVAGRHN